MPFAARVADPLQCAMHTVPTVPTSGVVKPRMGTVRIGFMIAARQGDATLCAAGGATGTILEGDPTVRIEGLPAARMLDPVSHLSDPVTHLGVPCGVIQIGCPTVRIGILAQAQTLLAGAREGAPFCAECAARASGPPVTQGTVRQAEALRAAAQSGLPFCAECEKGKDP